MMIDGADLIGLTRDLCSFATGVVADDNESLFARVDKELPLTIHRFRSGDSHNGWVVPENWRVLKASISRNGAEVFDGLSHTLAVARYSRSFTGALSWQDLQPHLVTNPALRDASVFHCMWQYRPWAADWAFSIPYRIYETFGEGIYEIDLRTEYESGEMLVGEYTHRGESDRTIVFQSHSCHPHMANDGFAGTAILIRLFQWLSDRRTRYTYRFILGPEHLGTVFYLRDRDREDVERVVGGIFAEMPGTHGPIKKGSTFLGNQGIDRAVEMALESLGVEHVSVPWRRGAGNDETVWEAPGYEVPFVELTRSEDLLVPFREYHTDLDGPDLMDPLRMEEFFEVVQCVVEVLEGDARPLRRFDGLICLSNPQYDLYMERPDPAVKKELDEESERWGYLLDSLLRYLDGSMTILDISERHSLPFKQVLTYLERFRDKDLVALEPAWIDRPPITGRHG